ncbi:pyrroline-5-carboxylate reductase dimerization domain-containing protein, partial [Flavobacterium sp.]|uniref:pyrroline-5-carboxylate reductase family protein n=1 Tax=Flavobacterium sp. TaxID=239 RepID=UPI0022C20E5E
MLFSFDCLLVCKTKSIDFQSIVVYFMQSMIKVTKALWFDETDAELLVNQTFMGSVAIQNSYSLSNEQWIAKVASKGGTTERALQVFEKGTLEETIVD